jgi:hypothetical protein
MTGCWQAFEFGHCLQNNEDMNKNTTVFQGKHELLRTDPTGLILLSQNAALIKLLQAVSAACINRQIKYDGHNKVYGIQMLVSVNDALLKPHRRKYLCNHVIKIPD